MRLNDEPYSDHGIEVLYRFAAFDPFLRSDYFGRRLDLGQFERFRRVVHMPAFATLLRHERATVLSSLEARARAAAARHPFRCRRCRRETRNRPRSDPLTA